MCSESTESAETTAGQLFFSDEEMLSRSNDFELFYDHNVRITRYRNHDGITLSAAIVEHANPQAQLVIIPGRGENPHKYAEFLYCTRNLKLNTAILFARGHGLSQRLLADPQKCHLHDFDSQAQDIEYLIKALELGPFRMLSFSLGSLIALQYIYCCSQLPEKAVFVAPYLCPKSLETHPNANYFLLSLICSIPGMRTCYTPHGREYCAVPFADNVHSHSKVRYEYYHAYYSRHPEETIGQPTFGFVWRTMQAQRRLFRSMPPFTFPSRVYLAGDDRIVSSSRAEVFFKQHCCDPVPPEIQTVQGSFHDVLNESAKWRNNVLCSAMQFLAQR